VAWSGDHLQTGNQHRPSIPSHHSSIPEETQVRFLLSLIYSKSQAVVVGLRVKVS